MTNYITSEGILIFSLILTMIYSMGILVLYIANILQRKFPKFVIITLPIRMLAILFLIYRIFTDTGSLLLDYQSETKIPIEIKPVIFIIIIFSIIIMRKIESKTRTLKSLGNFVIPATDRNIPVEIEDYNNIGELFEYAQRDGYSNAMYELGKLYYEGVLVTQNIIFARYWLKKSASEDYLKAKDYLSKIEDVNDAGIASNIEFKEKN